MEPAGGRSVTTAAGPRLSVGATVQRGDFELDVDITVQPGTTVALLGPNGAGKSTLFGLIAGLDDLDGVSRLSVQIGDRVLTDSESGIHAAASERSIGQVFQDHLLFAHLDVADNVAFGPRSSGHSRARSREIARHWIDRLGLTELAGRRPDELSGGQAQRVAIARTLAASPDVLLFDEPLAALDVSSRTELRRALRSHLVDFSGPRLIVTHDPTDAFVLADEIIVLENGRITQRGTPDHIRRHPTTSYVAAIGGTNLLRGTADSGTVTLTDDSLVLTVADTVATGDVVVTIHPRTISLHVDRPSGSQRNVWQCTVDLVERLGDIVRVSLAGPVRISADVTPGSVDALGLAEGSTVWAAVKATEIGVTPA